MLCSLFALCKTVKGTFTFLHLAYNYIYFYYNEVQATTSTNSFSLSLSLCNSNREELFGKVSPITLTRPLALSPDIKGDFISWNIHYTILRFDQIP